MTHAELVVRAAAWLRNRGCSVVLTDRSSSARERPDAIGWAAGAVSHVVEVKVSRSDFFADADKCCHRSGVLMGAHRWYFTPRGLLTLPEVPERFGLVEVRGERTRIMRPAPHRAEASMHDEVRLLLSELSIIHAAQRGEDVIDTGRARQTLAGFADVRWAKNAVQAHAEYLAELERQDASSIRESRGEKR